MLTNTLKPFQKSLKNLLVIFFEQEMQNLSLPNWWVAIWFQRSLLIWRRDFSGYTLHSYRRSAATAVADAGSTSEQMRNFFGWASTKMTAEYILTSKAAVINVASKLAASEKTIATSLVSTTVEEVVVVGKEKEITTVELNRGGWERGALRWVAWWFVMCWWTRLRLSLPRNIRETNPMKIESGEKVFYLSNCTMENFTYWYYVYIYK